MKINYKPKGTCSTDIELEVQDGRIEKVVFKGGCNGNLQGISSLVKGMRVEDVISRLEGIHCGVRSTSCPDQLCKALRALQPVRILLGSDLRISSEYVFLFL